MRELKSITKDDLNQEVTFIALLIDVKIKATKTGGKYADLTVQDASSKQLVKLWDVAEEDWLQRAKDEIPVIEVKALVGEYQGKLQLTSRSIRKVDKDSIDMKKLVPSSKWNFDQMQQWLEEFRDRIQTPLIKTLVHEMVFQEPYYEKFCIYPAAKSVHHNFRHGILQHTLEVLKYCVVVATTKRLSQRQVDRLIAMAFLHDWAKIIEYEPLPSNKISDEGKMLGHIFIGSHHVMNKIELLEGFDREDALVILNGILGHHGALEWGSPVLPKSVEAQILHQADKLSGDVESILSFMQEQEESRETFTDRLWNMGTDYYKGGIS
ncbi:3'-5' exoribonuclease YhaM family protein [Tindallia californiensis]|uniref:3'-5' exoribonuclease n=1 Tax=Tindallia californiensis TaxID=159292 RepID=A0A1H3K7U7_9FIRM|nr:HD domain-containing protein [Tindallia californiensis]SDY47835.1 3'-5' exoribonuclease [Tindallia californiensis]